MTKKGCRILVIFVSILLAFSPGLGFNEKPFSLISDKFSKSDQFSLELDSSKKILKPSESWNLTGSPIYIDDSDPNYNWSKTATDNNWCTGNGIWHDPYIIENITINGLKLDTCIEIKNSNQYFVIQNCTLYNSKDGDMSDAGISLLNVNNSKVIDNNCSYNTMGIWLENSYNNTLENNIVNYNYHDVISNWGNGIRLQYSNNNTLINNTVFFNQAEGITCHNSRRNRIIQNNASHIRLNGNLAKFNILLYNSIDLLDLWNSVNNNTIDFNNIKDLNLYNAKNNSFTNNTITGKFSLELCAKNNITSNIFKEQGLEFDGCTFNQIINNTFLNADIVLHNTHWGPNYNNTINQNLIYNGGFSLDITLEEAINNIIDESNLINDKPLNFYYNKSGLNSDNFLNAGQIILLYCNNSLITGHSISNTSTAIEARHCNNLVISNNTVINCFSGVILSNFIEPNVIENNTIKNTVQGIILIYGADYSNVTGNKLSEIYAYGIGIQQMNHLNISGNFISKSTFGLLLHHDDDSIVKGNQFHNNTRGIFLYGAWNNNISNNLVIDNDEGLILDPGSEGNIIYYNEFLNNGLHALDNGTTNQWDDGLIGNYWDDYTGMDGNYDGIGDTPYNITGLGGSKDRFPIMYKSPPIIIIITPLKNTAFGANAPEFELFINDPYLDTMWYTIDGGISNYTCITNGTINQEAWDVLPEGNLILRFYANDSLGLIGFNEIQISKDSIIPVITINSPLPDETFGNISPDFDITVIEVDLVSTWYTIEGIAGTFSFSELTGSLNQDAWNDAPEGEITITFFALDSAGNIGNESVTVMKSIPSQPVIPGYNMFILIGAISTVLVFIIKKKLKK